MKAFQQGERKDGSLALVPFSLQGDEFENFLNSRLADVATYRTPDGHLVFTGENVAANSQ